MDRIVKNGVEINLEILTRKIENAQNLKEYFEIKNIQQLSKIIGKQ